MAAVWFKGVQRQICLDYNDIVKLVQKCFMNSASIVNRSHHSHVRTRANHCRASMTYLEKQVDLYVRRHELDWDFAGGSVPFCAPKLTVVD